MKFTKVFVGVIVALISLATIAQASQDYFVYLPIAVKATDPIGAPTTTSMPTATSTLAPSSSTPIRTPVLTSTPTNTPTSTTTPTPSATPTATPTPTNTPVPPIAVPNGGFESGRDPWVFVNASRSEGDAHTGQWNASLSSLFGAIIRQQVTVPNTHPYLTFWQQTSSLSNTCNVSAIIAINGQAVATYTSFCKSQNSYVWSKQTIDLTTYSGQQVNLEFGINQEFETDPDDAGLSVWYVDDVEFHATP